MCTSIWAQVASTLNNRCGFSMMETMLALFFFCSIFLTFIPMTNDLYDQMQQRRMRLYAMHVNYEATKRHQQNPQNNKGSIEMEGINYSFEVDTKQVCTSYMYKEELERSCVKYK